MLMPGENRLRVLWKRRPVRYIAAGGVNTLMSYVIGACCLYLLLGRVHYIFIMAVSAIACVTFSYVNYKVTVFRTKGNFFREYPRFYVVYAVPIGVSFLLFPPFYRVLGLNPYLSQAVVTAITVVASYRGHKRFSFGAAGE
jgi:putative flippase GtrA